VYVGFANSELGVQVRWLVSNIATIEDSHTMEAYHRYCPRYLRLRFFADADCASDKDTRTSTLDMFSAQAGPHLFLHLELRIDRKEKYAHVPLGLISFRL
jgi:hypothetical protein